MLFKFLSALSRSESAKESNRLRISILQKQAGLIEDVTASPLGTKSLYEVVVTIAGTVDYRRVPDKSGWCGFRQGCIYRTVGGSHQAG